MYACQLTNGPEKVPLGAVGTQSAARATHAIASYTFLRVLGLCLLATFVSKLAQMPALMGSTGVTPLADLLACVRSKYAGDAWWQAPSLFWLGSGDGWLMTVTWLGLVASALLTLGLVPRLTCVVCYVVYISFRNVDDVPLRWCNWPFDELLTEATFLGIWLAPRGVWSSLQRPWNPPAWARWLLLWVLFRLMFGTGITKLLAGGSWLELNALQDFLLAQPQPTAFAAWCSELPPWLLQAAAAYTISFEVVAPWLFFWPGRVRRIAALCGMPLMLVIYLTGNFRGLNLLSAALLLMLWDDHSLLRWLPNALRRRFEIDTTATSNRLQPVVGIAVCTLVAIASFEPVAAMLGVERHRLPAATVRQAVRPLGLSAYYFMFCSVPGQRFQLVLQGSADGNTWRSYEPYGLPSAVDRNPSRTAPGHAYLAFPMWLAGYGPPALADAWLPRLFDRLLAGEPSLRALFANDPFPDAPPRFVRTVRYQYAFAPAKQRASGTFWQRTQIEVHLSAGK